MADLLLGLPSLAIHDQTFNGNITGRRWKLYRPFVEDDWRVTKRSDAEPRLGLGSGDADHRSANRQADFNPANGQFLIAGQNAGPRAGIQMD